jgi:limonene-1,2-epoxide hydrolase
MIRAGDRCAIHVTSWVIDFHEACTPAAVPPHAADAITPMMDTGVAELLLSRRNRLLAGGTAGALAAGCTQLGATGSGAGGQTPLGAANADLVTRFCLDPASRDVEKLVPYLADTLVYQMFEQRPDLIGSAEFRQEVGPFLADLASVEWEILRTFTIGQVVINERVDHFIARPVGQSMHFAIVGLFVVRNQRIELWRDYSLPGSRPRMKIGKAPAA